MIRVTLETFNLTFFPALKEDPETAHHHGTLRIWPDSTEGLYHVQLWEAPTGHFHCAAEFTITGKMGDYWGLVRTALAKMRRGEDNE